MAKIEQKVKANLFLFFKKIFSKHLSVQNDCFDERKLFKIFSKQFEAYGSLGTNFSTFVPMVTI